MTNTDPITAGLMAKGAPFEVVTEGGLRVFKHAPKNLTAVFDQARKFGPAEFIVSGETRLTYDQFFKHADNLAAFMQTKIEPGQSVAVCMKNCPEWMMAFVAVLNAGGVAVLINSRGTGETMALAVSDADCVFVLADEKRLELLRAGGCDLPSLAADQVMDLPDTPLNSVDRLPSDLAAMLFTSGTTGRAKAAAASHLALVTGTMNTQMAMVSVFQKMANAHGIDIETLRSHMPQPCSLLVFPLFHTSGCSAMFLTALTTGGKLVLMDRWSGAACAELIEREKITNFGGVPTMHWDLLRAENFDRCDLSSLMSLSVGGQALPLSLLAEIRAAFPKAFIGAGYGMTETSGAISQANGEAFLANPKASGTVLPMIDVRIVSEDGADVTAGDVGEIWTRGAVMMDGYYGRPEDNAKAFEDGWFKTGDIGRMDDNGYLYIVDRKTDMVISGGENIYCAEVEQAIGQHKDVMEVTSFGIPDDRLGERLIASVVTASKSLTREDLMAFAKDHIAAYKVPTDIVVRTLPFTHNAMGKVEKNKVREAYLAQRAA